MTMKITPTKMYEDPRGHGVKFRAQNSLLVYIQPKLFLTLAAQTSLDEDTINEYQGQIITNQKIDMPYLEVRGGEVIGHEGRHRTSALNNLGFDFMLMTLITGNTLYKTPGDNIDWSIISKINDAPLRTFYSLLKQNQQNIRFPIWLHKEDGKIIIAHMFPEIYWYLEEKIVRPRITFRFMLY